MRTWPPSAIAGQLDGLRRGRPRNRLVEPGPGAGAEGVERVHAFSLAPVSGWAGASRELASRWISPACTVAGW